MAKKLINPFDLFSLGEQKVFIEALDAEITFRPILMDEADGFNKRLLGNYTGKGDPVIDLAEATKINYEKIELCMVDPKMTVKDLKALPASASKAITEIVKAIDGRDDDVEDDEGTDAGN